MIVVIQCAASKRPDAGKLRTRDGRPVLFVADPGAAPVSDEHLYARPDDPSDSGPTWRKTLLRYNDGPKDNPLGLLPAWQLYAHPAYRRLAENFGLANTYILSAGWGLIGATFLTPDYDITFSASAEPYKHRKKADLYDDACMLGAETAAPIVFLGGKAYVPLFCALTSAAKGPRTIFYNSDRPPSAPDCRLIRYETSTRTNWHYECAGALLDGKIAIPA
jgi:hypothetical protein